MISEFALGSLVISASIIVEVVFLGMAELALLRTRGVLGRLGRVTRMMAVLVPVTLWLMAAHSIAVWMWAGLFIYVDVFQSWEEAVYFSLVSFTTLGFGDVIVEGQWRLLSGLAASNGLLIFGVSTAFLVEVIGQVRRITSRP